MSSAILLKELFFKEMPMSKNKSKRLTFYYMVYDAWGSNEDNTAYAEAVAKFEELEKTEEYVALIQSHHFATPGYWVENHKSEVNYPDHILKQKQS